MLIEIRLTLFSLRGLRERRKRVVVEEKRRGRCWERKREGEGGAGRSGKSRSNLNVALLLVLFGN